MYRKILGLTVIIIFISPTVALAKLGCPNWVMTNGIPESVYFGPHMMDESITSPNSGEVRIHIMPHAGYAISQGDGPYTASGYNFWIKPLTGWIVLYRQTEITQIPEYGPWRYNLTYTEPEWRELSGLGQLGEGQTYIFTGLPAGKWGFFFHQNTELHGPALVHDRYLELMRDEIILDGTSGKGICENEIGTAPGIWTTVQSATPMRIQYGNNTSSRKITR